MGMIGTLVARGPFLERPGKYIFKCFFADYIEL